MGNKNFDRIMRGFEDAIEIMEGKADPSTYRVHVPDAVDVKAIRKKLKMTQAAFAARYGFSISAIRDWEQQRRQPEASARVLLKVVEKYPHIVEDALGDVA
ncbi:MAG: helix-turn-helix domain-containing protein [Parvularculaceae bacterium]|nr:helix-turn-helix domain-containing protein [Parvularculaceae bacterium]